jgi:lambda repressor-like predicted transcriptional regulator
MNTKDFCARAEAALGGRGWMARLSESTGIHYSTVKRWAAGDLPPPEWTHALIELLEITPAAMRPSRFVKPPRARSGA